jgi:hypothetical protein
MNALIDLTGDTFGRLTVLSRQKDKVTPNGTSFTMWLCRCSCGLEIPASSSNLKRGHTTSCGCWMRDRITKHGGARGYTRTPEYSVWQAMRGRCRSNKGRAFSQYKGRGISVCERWEHFENFLADMGQRPSLKHSIERINNDGNYEPNNCRWATNAEQQMNKRTSRNSTSGVTGVSFHSASGKWTAWIKLNRVQLFLGSFPSKDEAAIARVAAVRVREEIFAQQCAQLLETA